MKAWFDRFARYTAWALGTVWAFVLATLTVLVWAASGPLFDWSDSHSLAINTITTVITYLMVFVIQNTQNRDTAEVKAMLRQLTEDISEVDEVRAVERAAEEERP